MAIIELYPYRVLYYGRNTDLINLPIGKGMENEDMGASLRSFALSEPSCLRYEFNTYSIIKAYSMTFTPNVSVLFNDNNGYINIKLFINHIEVYSYTRSGEFMYDRHTYNGYINPGDNVYMEINCYGDESENYCVFHGATIRIDTGISINKVQKGTQTILDVSQTTAEDYDVCKDKLFVKKNGEYAIGTNITKKVFASTSIPETSFAENDNLCFVRG